MAHTIYKLKNDWSIEKTLTTPVRKGLYNATSRIL